jgi:hypothetical protein
MNLSWPFRWSAGVLLPGASLETAANGHRQLDWTAASHRDYVILCWRLRFQHGLRREGRGAFLGDDLILPDLVRDGLRLKSGWDNWSGYYLLSEDQAGGRFLERLATEVG